MTATENTIIRKLYNEACHGAGATVRKSARASLEAMLNETGETMLDVFERNNLCIHAYFASRPF